MELWKSTRFVVALALFSISMDEVAGQGNMCGVNAPDPMKTCISLRLPWQPEPLYFCIEKDKFRYKNHCSGSNMMHCGSMDMMRNDTLILATPWECCPYTSVPDHCMHTNCPPAPLNRKCVVLDTHNLMSWDCCPKYFCEENMTPENCQMKRLDPICVNPPMGKLNCVGFRDPYGCCTKYQCDGEGKAGMCPMQHQAMQLMMRFNTSQQMMMNMGNGQNMRPPASPVGMDDVEIINYSQRDQNGVGNIGKGPLERWSYFNGAVHQSTECVGDSNCGGNMKCCSNDMTVYGDGRYLMRNLNPTNGHCVEPIMMAVVKP